MIHPVCIIGAGPAGIATAVELLDRGYRSEDIIILEKSGEVAHMIATKYPDEKPVLANYKNKMAECEGNLCIKDMSKQDFMDYMESTIEEKNLQVRYHQTVEKVVLLKNGQQWRIDTQEDSWIVDVVFVAIGNMTAPRSLGAPIDEKLNHLVHDDIQKIEDKHRKVLVVGGGDSASEYAQILCQRGHEVTLSYRKDKFIRQLPQNVEKITELIEQKRVVFHPSTEVKSIQATKNGPRAELSNGTFVDTDSVVTALGNEKPKAYLEKIGISLEMEDGGDFLESPVSGLFLVGDLASGPKGGSINYAFNSGVHAVEKACDLYLDCEIPAQ